MDFLWDVQNKLHETLLILVREVSRGKHKLVINKGFHFYIKKVHKINSSDNGSLHQWFKGFYFPLYMCTVYPVDGTLIVHILLAIGR